MLGLEMLDVAIGIIFIYLLLSLVCSALNEMIELKLKSRAINLERGIRELLNGAGTKDNAPANPEEDVVARLYKHPLIGGLFQGSYQPKSKNLPSYIPARNFALALMDIVCTGNDDRYSGSSGATAENRRSVLSNEFMALRAACSAFPQKNVREALIPLVDAAGPSANGARQNIEAWFDSSMDRVSGWYKRRAQKIILGLGLVITVAINADTVAILNSLNQGPALRSTLVEAAQEYAKLQPQDSVAAPQQRVTDAMKQIRELGLPIGWNSNDARLIPRTAGGWLLKLFGWLLTGMAITLGAPFWFDLLNKFMVIRSTVKPHEKSPEEASEDRQVSATEQAVNRVTPNVNVSSGSDELTALFSAPFQPNEWNVGDPQEGTL